MKKLFADKYKSEIIQGHLYELVEKMTDLKRENYYAMKDVDKRKDQIREIELALTELNVPFEKDYDPIQELSDYD
jgi:uncharacterized protein (UPF0305 family)